MGREFIFVPDFLIQHIVMDYRRFFQEDIKGWDDIYRKEFINSLGGFKSINLIGTMNSSGQTNLSLVSSVVHVGSKPPLLGYLLRPMTVRRDTYENLHDTGFFTVNHVHWDIFKPAHQTSARYPAEVSEFEATGLTPEYSDMVKAPYVQESHIKIGLKLKEEIKIQANGTVFLIGEIIEVRVPDYCLHDDGFLDIENAGSLVVSGLDSYHGTSRIARLIYAKPFQPVAEKR